jgi:hypothetical protein
MITIPIPRWIVDAGARFSGRWAAVSQQAKQSNCSRQTVYERARKVLQAVTIEYGGGPKNQDLVKENQTLREENAHLRAQLQQAVEISQSQHQEFSAKARSMGLSLNQICVLLAVLLPPKQAPARSTVERWVQAAGRAASRVLRRLDGQCKALVLWGCLDEIFFHGHPIIVAVEPRSMMWFIGKRVTTLKGSIWAEQLKLWDALEYVVADAGRPLQGGIAQVQRQRCQDNQTFLASALDVFHTKKEAREALASVWKEVERSWDAYDEAAEQVQKNKRAGIDSRSATQRAIRAWARTVKSFEHYETIEAAWKQAALALNVFRPDGQLNDRAWAEAQVASALPALVGRAWVTVRNHLQAPEAFTFLDHLHSELARVPVSDELRDVLVRVWWLRRQRPRETAEAPSVGASPVAHLVQQVLWHKVNEQYQVEYRQVAKILRGAVRASSLVECMNSVLRMHQARHRTVTQEMLDLKRLYWNCREFVGGSRRGKCPYEHLGLVMPSFDFWGLLQPEFAQALNEAKAQAKEKNQVKAA